MFNSIAKAIKAAIKAEAMAKARAKVIHEMTLQGNQHQEQELFFKKFWKAMRESFSEENHTSSATFILERLLAVLPVEYIYKDALIHTIDRAYKDKGAPATDKRKEG